MDILIIEDDPDNLRSVAEAAEDAKFCVQTCTTGKAGIDAFCKKTPDVVLSDLVLPDIDGLQVLAELKKINPQVPVIIMTAYGSVESGVRAMKEGAYDYVTKPLDLEDIQAKLRRAYETSSLRKKVDTLADSVRTKFGAANMVAESPGMKVVLSRVEALAPTNSTVLIRGESGTGKELVARALHADSPRRNGPFVAVNCGAFTENLLESELFGHEKGAFTGAVCTYRGAFEQADGGTLFLDEIGDAPPSVQVKLLRTLEEREVRRVGGSEVFKVNVRLVSATNKNLEALMKEGKFREDLFYRLNVVAINIPPLRNRVEDVRPLADRFIAKIAAENGRKITAVTPAFYSKLERYGWPGNIRQLRNIVESAVLLSPDGVLDEKSAVLPDDGTFSESFAPLRIPKGMTLEDVEKVALESALSHTHGNRKNAAEALGISRRTMQRKIKEHGLEN